MGDSFRIERIDAAHVRAVGVLGFDAAARGYHRADSWIDAARGPIELDVSGLEKIDSATLAVLLAWTARAATHNVRLSIRGAPPPLLALARLCSAAPLLGIH